MSLLKKISITGGGAFKYSKELIHYFGNYSIVDEMNSTVKGAFFIIDRLETDSEFRPNFPIVLANVGTGASFLLIDKHKNVERIGGTNIAGGTFTGISSLLTQGTTSDDYSLLIEKGNKSNVDTLVRDIYGKSYVRAGLDGNIVAGSLDKVPHYSGDNLTADVCSSSAFMICNNVVHLLSLYVLIHNALAVFIAGSFSAIPSVTTIFKESMRAKLKVQSKVLKYGGYLGCFGIVSDIIDNKTKTKKFITCVK